MIKDQKIYLIICLSISSLMLYTVNVYTDLSITRLSGYIRMATGLFLVISTITLIIYAFQKSLRTYKISIVTLSIFFILNLILVSEVVAYEFHKYEMAKINEIDTCEKAEVQFTKDLENGKIKYFMFGIGSDEELNNNLEEEYDLRVYHLGCIVTPSYKCYNELVEKHFEEKSNIDFWGFSRK